MSSRLPTVGSDSGDWGTILNDFLQQALNSNGTLVSGATNTWTSSANTNLSSGSSPGLVQLAGDLGNTAVSPTVVGLQGNAVDPTSPTDGYVLTWSASGSKWTALAPVGGVGTLADLDGGNSTSVYSSSSIDGGLS